MIYPEQPAEFPEEMLLGDFLGIRFIINTDMTNNKAVKTGGYEQTRLIDSRSMERYYRFDSKYFYMQGFNYMLNLYFRF